ncbi:hypothetical protein DKX38_016473 [Salix brachista]|uniref:Protein kinase domain-containing protein n=1 Tax=Salix brachista TaxID=2182728 RepID=A0A5N5L8N2_9ROSI|nr:hypothetical protein DKX38_016473 [Salix brachista]
MRFSFSCSKCFSSSSDMSTDSPLMPGLQILQKVHAFSFNELKVATNGFLPSNKIGEGGFGSVYKGILQDGRIVAIKMLSAESRQGEREFMSEIASLSNISHENLGSLHGGCIDGPCKILVYDYMENGSLAQTLLVLNCVSICCKRGYLAPEYAISGRLTRKTDVYSFGVLLLEIVSGRKANDFDPELGEHYLVEKAWEMYEADNLPRLVDPMLDGNFSETEAVGFVKVALLCVQEKCRLRPNMSKAIKMMRGEIDIHSTQITRPGFIVDIMDVKIGRKSQSSGRGITNRCIANRCSPRLYPL